MIFCMFIHYMRPPLFGNVIWIQSLKCTFYEGMIWGFILLYTLSMEAQISGIKLQKTNIHQIYLCSSFLDMCTRKYLSSFIQGMSDNDFIITNQTSFQS